eukprot:820486-Ditylum_brightwellii.AAC.1
MEHWEDVNSVKGMMDAGTLFLSLSIIKHVFLSIHNNPFPIQQQEIDEDAMPNNHRRMAVWVYSYFLMASLIFSSWRKKMEMKCGTAGHIRGWRRLLWHGRNISVIGRWEIRIAIIRQGCDLPLAAAVCRRDISGDIPPIAE